MYTTRSIATCSVAFIKCPSRIPWSKQRYIHTASPVCQGKPAFISFCSQLGLLIQTQLGQQKGCSLKARNLVVQSSGTQTTTFLWAEGEWVGGILHKRCSHPCHAIPQRNVSSPSLQCAAKKLEGREGQVHFTVLSKIIQFFQIRKKQTFSLQQVLFTSMLQLPGSHAREVVFAVGIQAETPAWQS